MAGKVMTMVEAIDRFVPDGATVALGTALEPLIPFAAGHEMIRQGRRISTRLRAQVLRAAGLVNSKYDEKDRRFQLYYIPEVWRTEPEVLDFGFCILDLSVTQR